MSSFSALICEGVAALSRCVSAGSRKGIAVTASGSFMQIPQRPKYSRFSLQSGTHGRNSRHLLPVIAAILLCTVIAIRAQTVDTIEPDPGLFGRNIHDLTFSSDVPLNRSHYDPYLGIKRGDVLTRTGVKKAIQSLYESGRFSRILVEVAPAGASVDVCFNVRHNYYFSKIMLEGDFDLKDRSLWELVSLPIGQRFSREKLEASRQDVLKFIQDRGFYRAQVGARIVPDEKLRQVDVVFEVHSGDLAVIKGIHIRGVPPESSAELLKQFGFQPGKAFDRSRLGARMETLKKYFLRRDYLAATAQLTESYEPEKNSVDLILDVAHYGKTRVVVEGFKIDKDQLRRLLPVLAGEGINPEILNEGLNNLKDYLESRGYAEADVRLHETVEDLGVRVFHYWVLPSKKFMVAYVRFRGNKVFTDQEMLAVLEIQPASPYSVTRLDDDVDVLKNLYRARGYLQASVIPLVEQGKEGKNIGIVYVCEEGPEAHLRSLEIKGNTAFATKALMSKINLAPGVFYSPSLVEQDRQALLAAYNDSGYLQAQVAVRVGQPDDQNSYSVVYEINEGTQSLVDRIFVLGNDITKPSLIAKQIKLKEEQPLSLGKLLQTQQALYGIGVFDQVRVAAQNADSTAPYRDVVVRLQESKRFTIRYGLGYQEREKLRGTLEFSDLNIFGFGRRADLRLRGSSIEQQAIFTLRKPQFHVIPVDSNFTFSALQKKDVSFDTRKINLAYQFSHPFGTHSWGMLRYSFKYVKVTSTSLPLSELGREDQPVNLSTFSAAFINDTRDDYLDPTKGFFSSTDFGYTPEFWGSNKYFSFFTQNSYYRKLPMSFQFASSLRFGAAHPLGGYPDIPISERYFAGGASSLRGFETDYAGPLDSVSNKPVGGNGLVVGSVEIRAPIFRFIHFAGFYDTGNVFRTVRDINLSGFSHTLGGGLRIKTPFGPLRADYGYNIDLSPDLRHRGLTPSHFFITIGPPF
jgi:outer membrane protein insertion porin family